MIHLIKMLFMPVGLIEHLILRFCFLVQNIWDNRRLFLLMSKYEILMPYIGSVLAYRRHDNGYSLKLIRDIGHDLRQTIKVRQIYGRALTETQITELKSCLIMIYAHQVQVELTMGRFEEAMMTAIVACDGLNISHIPGKAALDLRLAHVLKAGLAANKMLQDGGLATMTLRQDERPEVYQPAGPKPKKPKKPNDSNVIPFKRR